MFDSLVFSKKILNILCQSQIGRSMSLKSTGCRFESLKANNSTYKSERNESTLFQIHTPISEWVAIGFSNNGSFTGADFIVGENYKKKIVIMVSNLVVP